MKKPHRCILLAFIVWVNLKESFSLPVPEDELDTSTRLLGSSVVTSVSIVTGTEKNGGSILQSRKVVPGFDLPPSPGGLLRPDRFQFYTLNKNGEVVTKQMTEKEIQTLIAAGGGHFPTEIHESQTAGNAPTSGMKVADVVQNVQNVLKSELSKPTTVMTSVPTIPGHATDEWSSILPSILAGDMETQSLAIPDSETTEVKNNAPVFEMEAKPQSAVNELKFKSNITSIKESENTQTVIENHFKKPILPDNHSHDSILVAAHFEPVSIQSTTKPGSNLEKQSPKPTRPNDDSHYKKPNVSLGTKPQIRPETHENKPPIVSSTKKPSHIPAEIFKTTSGPLRTTKRPYYTYRPEYPPVSYSEIPMIPVHVITADQIMTSTPQYQKDTAPVFQVLNTISAETANATKIIQDPSKYSYPVYKPDKLSEKSTSERPKTTLPEIFISETSLYTKLPELVTVPTKTDTPLLSVVSETHTTSVKIPGFPETPLGKVDTTVKPEIKTTIAMKLEEQKNEFPDQKILDDKFNDSSTNPLVEPVVKPTSLESSKPDDDSLDYQFDKSSTVLDVTTQLFDSESTISFGSKTITPVLETRETTPQFESKTTLKYESKTTVDLETKTTTETYRATTQTPDSKVPVNDHIIETTVSDFSDKYFETTEASTLSTLKESQSERLPVLSDKVISPETSAIEKIIETLHHPTESKFGTTTIIDIDDRESEFSTTFRILGEESSTPVYTFPTNPSTIEADNTEGMTLSISTRIKSSTVPTLMNVADPVEMTTKPYEPLPTELADSLSSMISQISEAVPSLVSQSSLLTEEPLLDDLNTVGIFQQNTESSRVTQDLLGFETTFYKHANVDIGATVRMEDSTEKLKDVDPTSRPKTEISKIGQANESVSNSPFMDSVTTASLATSSMPSSISSSSASSAASLIIPSTTSSSLSSANSSASTVSATTFVTVSPTSSSTAGTTENLKSSSSSSSSVMEQSNNKPTESGNDQVPQSDESHKVSSVDTTEKPIIRVDVTEPGSTNPSIDGEKNNGITESSVIRIHMADAVSMINNLLETAPTQTTASYIPLTLPESENILPNLIGSGLVAGFLSKNETNYVPVKLQTEPSTPTPSIKIDETKHKITEDVKNITNTIQVSDGKTKGTESKNSQDKIKNAEDDKNKIKLFEIKIEESKNQTKVLKEKIRVPIDEIKAEEKIDDIEQEKKVQIGEEINKKGETIKTTESVKDEEKVKNTQVINDKENIKNTELNKEKIKNTQIKKEDKNKNSEDVKKEDKVKNTEKLKQEDIFENTEKLKQEDKLKDTEKIKQGDIVKNTEKIMEEDKILSTEEIKKQEKVKTEEVKKEDKIQSTEEIKKQEKVKTEEVKKEDKIQSTEEIKKQEKIKTEEVKKDQKVEISDQDKKVIDKSKISSTDKISISSITSEKVINSNEHKTKIKFEAITPAEKLDQISETNFLTTVSDKIEVTTKKMNDSQENVTPSSALNVDTPVSMLQTGTEENTTTKTSLKKRPTETPSSTNQISTQSSIALKEILNKENTTNIAANTKLPTTTATVSKEHTKIVPTTTIKSNIENVVTTSKSTSVESSKIASYSVNKTRKPEVPVVRIDLSPETNQHQLPSKFPVNDPIQHDYYTLVEKIPKPINASLPQEYETTKKVIPINNNHQFVNDEKLKRVDVTTSASADQTKKNQELRIRVNDTAVKVSKIQSPITMINETKTGVSSVKNEQTKRTEDKIVETLKNSTMFDDTKMVIVNTTQSDKVLEDMIPIGFTTKPVSNHQEIIDQTMENAYNKLGEFANTKPLASTKKNVTTFAPRPPNSGNKVNKPARPLDGSFKPPVELKPLLENNSRPSLGSMQSPTSRPFVTGIVPSGSGLFPGSGSTELNPSSLKPLDTTGPVQIGLRPSSGFSSPRPVDTVEPVKSELGGLKPLSRPSGSSSSRPVEPPGSAQFAPSGKPSSGSSSRPLETLGSMDHQSAPSGFRPLRPSISTTPQFSGSSAFRPSASNWTNKLGLTPTKPSFSSKNRPSEPLTHKPTEPTRIKKPDENLTDEKWALIPQPNTSTTKLIKPTKHVTKPQVQHSQVPLDSSQSAIGLDASIRNLEPDVIYFSNLCNELAFSFWTAANKGLSTTRSLVLSPFGMTSLLAMVFLGARGPTSSEMNDVLKLDDVATFNPHLVFQNVTDAVSLSRKQGIANAAFVRELFADKSKVGKLMPFYKKQAQQFYEGFVEEVNFHAINDIVKRRTNLLIRKQTDSRIKDFVRTNTVGLRPPLAALSANVFQTECGGASSEGRDGELYFSVSPAIRQRQLVRVPATLWKSGVLAGYEPSLDATAIALGGIEKLVSTIFVIPGQQGHMAQGDNLDNLEIRLMRGAQHDGAWEKLLKVLIPRASLELQVPKFSHRSIVNATAALKRMGLGELFSKHADLKGINGIGHDLHLADVLQMNLFSTCGDENISIGRHHMETYPEPPMRNYRKMTESEDADSDQLNDDEDIYSEEPFINLSNLEDDFSSSRTARKSEISEKPKLKLDRPFLYFVRHNPTGLILHMGRFNPRITEKT